MRLTSLQTLLGLTCALILAACGGGGSSAGSASGPSGASSVALSSGTITAFGSIFVNGHEFDSNSATITDDDSGSQTDGNNAASALAVGMTVDVSPAAASTNAKPKAQEIRVVPLVRGAVDASDLANGQLSVMGQLVQLSPSSVIKDARSCVATSTCSPGVISDQSGLVANCTQSGAAAYTCSATAATNVQVFGFLDASSGSSTITATLVRVIDNNSSGKQFYRATGAITVAGSGTPPASYTINGLSFASQTSCINPINCGFASGNVVTTRGTAAPVLGTPGTTLPIPVVFTPTALRLSHAASLNVGSTIELEGVVSNASGSTFQLQGFTVTLASGQTLPANGDRVEVTGTVTSTAPPAITASSLSTEDEAGRHLSGFLLEDTLAANAVTTVAPATTPASYNVSILGATVQVNGKTHLEDETVSGMPAFNINTFASYIGTGTPHVVIRGYIDTSGSSPVLVAADLRIVKAPALSASFNARVAGAVTDLTSTDFTVDTVKIPTGAGITVTDLHGNAKTLAVGDFVRIRLNDAGGVLAVAGPVIDLGPGREKHGGD